MKGKEIIAAISVVAVSLLGATSFGADRSTYHKGKSPYYKVTVTNITRGESFTPILVATHKKGVKLFTPGSPASRELAMLAEGGATGPLGDSLAADPRVGHLATTGGLLGPGQTISVEIPYGRGHKYVSLAAMLIPTNDGFFSLNGVSGPTGSREIMYLSPAYDAGSEMNDELCISIPGGGDCAGQGFGEDDGEGYVHIHAGIHGTGDLDDAEYDWRNPVARIIIKKMIMDDDDE